MFFGEVILGSRKERVWRVRRKERKSIKDALASGHWNSIMLGTFGETVEKTPQNCFPEVSEAGHLPPDSHPP